MNNQKNSGGADSTSRFSGSLPRLHNGGFICGCGNFHSTGTYCVACGVDATKIGTMKFHTIPLNDGAIHCAQTTCFCQPTDTGDGVFVHHAQDCRERLERNGIVTVNGWAIIGEENKEITSR